MLCDKISADVKCVIRLLGTITCKLVCVKHNFLKIKRNYHALYLISTYDVSVRRVLSESDAG